jgi:hypothetical protein
MMPVDDTERAKRGVDGLRRDVLPSLVWGMTHVDLLEARLDGLRRLDPTARAVAMAAPFLPGGPPPEPRISIVMGGRAGAASLPGNEIYFDVLATSFKESAGGSPYPTADEQISFFAHEVHHLGYGPILEARRRELDLGPDEARAYELLTALLMEGSATYLINARRDIGALARDATYAEAMSRADGLLRTVSSVLAELLEHRLDAEGYEKAVAPLTGNGYHVAGATLLATIDRDGGLDAVLGVMRDPRGLLAAYDRAARNTSAGFRFPDPLARRVARIGAR